MTTPDRLPTRGTGIVDELAAGLPDWERMEPADWDPAWTADWDSAEPADWDPAETADWDPAELADWGPGDPEGELLELAGPDPEASGPAASDPKASEPAASGPAASGLAAERRGLGRAKGGSREALKAGPWGQAHGDGGWFGTGGAADDLLPGPHLAGFMADA